MRLRSAQRQLACLIALAVFAAQAACACRHASAAEAHVAPIRSESTSAASHACCRDRHPAAPQIPAGHAPDDRAPGCPHCDGSAALKAAVTGVASPAVDFSPTPSFVLPFEPVPATAICRPATGGDARFLTDPPRPSTLLALRCALTL